MAYTYLATACLVAFGLLFTAPSTAEEQTDEAPPVSASAAPGPGWELRVAPYVWGMSLSGDATVRGVDVEIDTPFKDVLSKLNGAIFGTVEFQRGRFILFGDVMAARLEDDFNTGTATVGFGPTTVARGPLSVAVPRVQTTVGPASVSSKTTLIGFEFYGGYRLFSRPVSGLFGDAAPDDTRSFDFDLVGGIRYWNIDQEIKVSVPPVNVPGFQLSPSLALPNRVVKLPGVSVPGVTLGGANLEVKETFEWVDPIIGMRVESDLSDRFDMLLAGAVGGFGIGSAANFSWEVTAMVNYAFAERWKFQLGYRVLGLDKDLGSANIDLLMHGPVIGVLYRFGPGANPRG